MQFTTLRLLQISFLTAVVFGSVSWLSFRPFNTPHVLVLEATSLLVFICSRRAGKRGGVSCILGAFSGGGCLGIEKQIGWVFFSQSTFYEFGLTVGSFLLFWFLVGTVVSFVFCLAFLISEAIVEIVAKSNGREKGSHQMGQAQYCSAHLLHESPV